MTLGEIFLSGGGVLVILLSVIEIAPIKANPWSFITRHLGKALNVELAERIDKDEAMSARYRIICFDDELRHSNTKHSEERFNQILDEIDVYERYCADHPKFENNKAVHAIEHVKDVYKKCRDEDSFI